MDANEILKIVEAFFNAIKTIFNALKGLFGGEAETPAEETTTESVK